MIVIFNWPHYDPSMSTLAEEIEHELQTLEPETAQHFERVLRDMLTLVKARHQPAATGSESLGDRLVNDPAIGTWPKELDGDAHVAALRAEWEDRS